MQYAESDFNSSDAAEIWRNAQGRRSNDLYALFAGLWKIRPHFKSSGFLLPHPLGYVRSLIWKLRATARIVSRTTH